MFFKFFVDMYLKLFIYFVEEAKDYMNHIFYAVTIRGMYYK